MTDDLDTLSRRMKLQAIQAEALTSLLLAKGIFTAEELAAAIITASQKARASEADEDCK